MSYPPQYQLSTSVHVQAHGQGQAQAQAQAPAGPTAYQLGQQVYPLYLELKEQLMAAGFKPDTNPQELRRIIAKMNAIANSSSPPQSSPQQSAQPSPQSTSQPASQPKIHLFIQDKVEPMAGFFQFVADNTQRSVELYQLERPPPSDTLVFYVYFISTRFESNLNTKMSEWAKLKANNLVFLPCIGTPKLASPLPQKYQEVPILPIYADGTGKFSPQNNEDSLRNMRELCTKYSR